MNDIEICKKCIYYEDACFCHCQLREQLCINNCEFIDAETVNKDIINEREYIDTDMMCSKAILNAIYGYKITQEQPKYNIIITLKNGIKRPANSEPISISEVIRRIYHMTKPTIYGKYIVKFEIIQTST